MNVLLIIVAVYLLVMILLGIFSYKKGNNSKHFHGANLGVLMCVAAGAGEWMGGTSTTGVSEYGYLYGISGAWYTIANGIGIMVCAFFFAKLYRSLNKPTVSGIVGHYIGEKARTASSIILLLVMLVVGVSQMVAIGSLGKVLFNMDISLSIAILGIVVIIYTLFGGMVSVGYTNTVHMIVLYVGIIVAVIYSVTKFGGGKEFIAQVPEGYLSFTSIGGTKIGSWVVASVLGACTAQAGIQPILAAKDEKTAFKSSILIALIVAPFGILTAILGIIAKMQFPDLENAKLALPSLMQNMPTWLAGLVTAAMMAAILSTASPILLACGTLFTKDVYPKLSKKAHKNDLMVSRIVTALAGVICVSFAIAIFDNKAVLDVVYFAYSLRGSLFVILLFGIYSKKYKPKEIPVIISMVLTVLVALFWVIWKTVKGSYPISPAFSDTYAAVATALISMIIIKLTSKEEKKELAK